MSDGNPDFVIFVTRSLIDNKHRIVDFVPYREVDAHAEFYKFGVTQAQIEYVENWDSDELNLPLLLSHFPLEVDQIFLNADRLSEFRDISKYGDAIRQYIIINPPEAS